MDIRYQYLTAEDIEKLHSNKELFHVHTYRCGHAGEEKDELYIQRAIDMGMRRITFTDHVPFPGDKIENRMDMKSLPEYVSTLKALREQYREQIEVWIGLEVEYLPGFQDYYKMLAESGDYDILILGQHIYECSPGCYSFSLDEETLHREKAEKTGRAIIEGMRTGYFQVVAHPDRMFEFCDCWTPELEQLSREIIKIAEENHIALEKNVASMTRHNLYWQEFWNLVPDSVEVIVGADAHAVSELDRVLF